MKNIYDGNVTTDQNGEATVELPDWFQALNRDFRYQLTVIGTFAQAIVAEKVKGNRFTIQTNAPNVEVSWQVTGIRKDGFADKHRIPVEEMKQEGERGLYLHPEALISLRNAKRHSRDTKKPCAKPVRSAKRLGKPNRTELLSNDRLRPGSDPLIAGSSYIGFRI